jgi:hypothetical protein
MENDSVAKNQSSNTAFLCRVCKKTFIKESNYHRHNASAHDVEAMDKRSDGSQNLYLPKKKPKAAKEGSIRSVHTPSPLPSVRVPAKPTACDVNDNGAGLGTLCNDVNAKLAAVVPVVFRVPVGVSYVILV